MSIKRYEVNGSSSVFEDESGSLVDYQDYAALEAKCAALAAENAGLKNFISEECLVRNPLSRNQLCAEDVSDALAPETPATDVFLAEVRASTLEDLAKKKRAEKMSLHPDTFALGSVIAALDMQANELEDLAHQLRQDANTAELVAAGIITRIEG